MFQSHIKWDLMKQSTKQRHVPIVQTKGMVAANCCTTAIILRSLTFYLRFISIMNISATLDSKWMVLTLKEANYLMIRFVLDMLEFAAQYNSCFFCCICNKFDFYNKLNKIRAVTLLQFFL